MLLVYMGTKDLVRIGQHTSLTLGSICRREVLVRLRAKPELKIFFDNKILIPLTPKPISDRLGLRVRYEVSLPVSPSEIERHELQLGRYVGIILRGVQSTDRDRCQLGLITSDRTIPVRKFDLTSEGCIPIED